ncbi:MAG: MFS transporter [Hyphomicrobiales bacterium]|nr:MFS transporter [Hyphomicrobiales bacterium]
MLSNKIVPLIVAVALFMENMDSTVIATSLPAIAADIGAEPLALKLAITSYLITLAVVLPVSGWTADRFGARTVFRSAILVFISGSIGCALSQSLTQFVIARMVEGVGGAMMTPVARLILVRTIDKRELVLAMIWVTIPALLGPLIGPVFGGFLTTYVSWHWIFIINVPMGLAGIVLATIYIEDIKAENPDPFDATGAALAGIGIAGLTFGGSTLGLNFLPHTTVIAMIVVGAAASAAYIRHSLRTPAPILDLSLLRHPTLRAAVVSGSLYRAGVGSLPFLLPLCLQLGFGLTAFQSGMITVSNVFGALGMKTIIPVVLRTFGFRGALTVNALVSAFMVGLCATFVPGVPFAWIVGVLLFGGFFRSLQYTSLNTIAYAEIDGRHMSRATTLVAVAQQLSLSVGVALAASLVDLALRWRGGDTIAAADFQPAWIIIALISGLTSLLFWRLPPNAGAEVSRRRSATSSGPTDAGDQKQG